MILCVEASQRDPNTLNPNERGNLADYELSADPIEAGEQVRRFLKGGYWVEVYNSESKELLAGPFDPDQPAPKYIL